MTHAGRTAARILSLTATATLAAAVFASSANASLVDIADAQIRGGAADPSFVGDGIYNDDAAGQTKTRLLERGKADSFKVRIENDGSGFSSFIVAGEGSANGFRVNYFADGVDITSAVTGGSYETGCLEDSDFDTLKLKITALRSANVGQSNATMVTVSPTGSCGNGDAPTPTGLVGGSDVVAARVVVKNVGGDKDGLGPQA